MKFIKSGQLAGSQAAGHRRWGSLLLVAAASLGVASLLTACDQLTGTLTIDFVYVTSARAAGPNQYGEIDVFEINQESGRMRQIPASPFPSGGRNPVSEAVHPDNETLYVVNRDDNTIVQFAIGTDGKLYPQNTVNTPGIFPVATAVAGTNLFVADTYVPLPTCSPASPCTGSVTAFPIAQKSTTINGRTFGADALVTGIPLDSCNGPAYLPLQLGGTAASDILLPTAVSASTKSSLLFVTATDTTSGVGYLFGYTIGSATCTIGGAGVSIVTLSPLAGSPFKAGVSPSAVVQDPSGSHVYVTDAGSNNVLAFAISSGTLMQLADSPAGNAPSSIVIDKTGTLAYVANSLDSTITGYKVAADGTLQAPATFAADTQPVAIGIDPAMNQYLFTANFLANTVSGFQINSTNGSLVNSQFSPYTANANPTAVAAIPHGSVVSSK